MVNLGARNRSKTGFGKSGKMIGLKLWNYIHNKTPSVLTAIVGAIIHTTALPLSKEVHYKLQQALIEINPPASLVDLILHPAVITALMYCFSQN